MKKGFSYILNLTLISCTSSMANPFSCAEKHRSKTNRTYHELLNNNVHNNDNNQATRPLNRIPAHRLLRNNLIDHMRRVHGLDNNDREKIRALNRLPIQLTLGCRTCNRRHAISRNDGRERITDTENRTATLLSFLSFLL